MRAAGVNQASGPVAPLELADPRPLRDGEILAGLHGHGVLRVTVGASFPLDQAAQALAQARRGAHGTAIVLRPGSADARR